MPAEPTRSYYQNSLRSCATCSAHILVTDTRGQYVYCPKCQAKRPSAEDWAASLKKGDLVYVQPAATLFPTAEHLIISRDGDTFEVQPLGLPHRRFTTTLAQLAQQSMVPRNRFGALS